ncbi:MFS transporter [Propionimicrobium lymphophilum]|uniref:MFS transporter n=1 Tax=Propionimicrobium TaxID=203133 RepID=UPI0003D797AA|nr:MULTISPECIES: MFS transporter [Propionimicrobium]ETJ97667.1 transporter, major facilitator family protein [Propionimicrobium sp. BV2F7]MDK7710423.1 MFS transporter [Propionimicrobium lymphophilum]MDK7733727.1 MFS transporter [Propionimicrobium lymphophilum]
MDDDIIRVEGVDRVFSRKKILIILLFGLALAMMSISSVNVALPSIQKSIGSSDTDLQWLLSGYALTFGIVLVAAGRIGDLLGRGITFIIGIFLFSTSALICGLIHDPGLLNIARLVQGIGAGFYSPQTNGMIVQYFRGQARATANALFGLVVSVAVAIAPLLTGFLIQWFGPDLGWRASFLWSFPVGVVTMILAIMWLPFESERRLWNHRKLGMARAARLDLDPVGMILMALSVMCVMLPFMIKTALSFALLPLGGLLLYIWYRWEKAYKKRGNQPMVDLHLFKVRSFTNATMVSGMQFLGGTSVFVIIALYLQNGLGASALVSGSIGLPNAIGSAVAAMIAGRNVLRRGRTMTMHSLGIYIVGLLMLITLIQFVPAISYWWLSIPLVFTGIGVGAFNSANQTLSMLELTPDMGGTAGGVKQTIERTTTAIGNAMLTAICFMFVAQGWRIAATMAYSVITLIIVLSLLLAWYDKRKLGDPEPLA